MAAATAEPAPVPPQQHPAFPTGTRLERIPGLGNALVADAPLRAGSVVIAEPPLLHVPELRPSNPLFKPLNAYFLRTHIPPSVVQKIAAFFEAPPAVRARVLQCYIPDLTGFAAEPVVQQALLFADTLADDPPLPEFARWLADDGGEGGEGRAAAARAWLVWVCNGHSYLRGSALFDAGSKVTHACGRPNTAYSSTRRTAAAAPDGGGGVHVALRDIEPGELLTTNYLGPDHRRLLAAPARRKVLREKFLFECRCAACTSGRDEARGLPCPDCSAAHRGADKLLAEEAVFFFDDGAADDDEDDDFDMPPPPPPLGFVYCDMAALAVGEPEPWRCDVCTRTYADDSAALMGRYYTRTHATIESELEAFVAKLDASLDDTPLMADPGAFHARATGVARLLGPRHGAVWRLLLVGVEVQCGEVDRLVSVSAAAAARGGGGGGGGGTATATPAARAGSPAAAAAALTAAERALSYMDVVWRGVDEHTGEDAAELLAQHFSEACGVLLQLADSSGLLAASDAAKVSTRALSYQRRVMPALERLARLLGGGGGAAGAGGGEAAAAAAAASGGGGGRPLAAGELQALVRELRQLEAAEAAGGGGD